MLTIAAAWGTAWLFMKMGLDGLEPFTIVFWRFIIALFAVVIIFHKKLSDISHETIKGALISGVLLFGVVSAVLYGLTTTMASTGGFIISVTTVFVAILNAVLLRRLPGLSIVIAIVLSIAGVALLTGAQVLEYDFGSLWIIVAAVLNSIYIVYVDRVSSKVNTLQLGILQLGVAAILALIASLFTQTFAVPGEPRIWIAVLGLGLICSAYCFVLQPIVQGYSTPERAGIIWSTESLFSAVFVFILLGERFTPENYLGAVLVMASVFVALLDWNRIKDNLKQRITGQGK